MKIVISCDHGGYMLKEELKKYLCDLKHEVIDLGTNSTESVDYPDFAHSAAQKVEGGEAEIGILICGSGIGMSIAANRHKGVRAALCTNEYMAAVARKHNNANVLCLGERVVGVELAKSILNSFLNNNFEGGRHLRRVEKL